jgi:hypothetical protein
MNIENQSESSICSRSHARAWEREFVCEVFIQ